jgi:hypothetical protein
MFVCLVLLLPAITGISAADQSSSTLCAPTAHAVVLYAPESNLERREIETLRTAKVSVDVAMYSFTDRELATELIRLARSWGQWSNFTRTPSHQLTFRVRAVPQPPRIMSERILVEPESLGSTSLAI